MGATSKRHAITSPVGQAGPGRRSGHGIESRLSRPAQRPQPLVWLRNYELDSFQNVQLLRCIATFVLLH